MPIAIDFATEIDVDDAEPRRMGMCDNCHGDHHIQQCPEIAGFDLVAYLQAQNAALRSQLDDAHQHIGALLAIAGIDQRYLATDYTDITEAARAWLRRGAR